MRFGALNPAYKGSDDESWLGEPSGFGRHGSSLSDSLLSGLSVDKDKSPASETPVYYLKAAKKKRGGTEEFMSKKSGYLKRLASHHKILRSAAEKPRHAVVDEEMSTRERRVLEAHSKVRKRWMSSPTGYSPMPEPLSPRLSLPDAVSEETTGIQQPLGAFSLATADSLEEVASVSSDDGLHGMESMTVQSTAEMKEPKNDSDDDDYRDKLTPKTQRHTFVFGHKRSMSWTPRPSQQELERAERMGASVLATTTTRGISQTPAVVSEYSPLSEKYESEEVNALSDSSAQQHSSVKLTAPPPLAASRSDGSIFAQKSKSRSRSKSRKRKKLRKLRSADTKLLDSSSSKSKTQQRDSDTRSGLSLASFLRIPHKLSPFLSLSHKKRSVLLSDVESDSEYSVDSDNEEGADFLYEDVDAEDSYFSDGTSLISTGSMFVRRGKRRGAKAEHSSVLSINSPSSVVSSDTTITDANTVLPIDMFKQQSKRKKRHRRASVIAMLINVICLMALQFALCFLWFSTATVDATKHGSKQHSHQREVEKVKKAMRFLAEKPLLFNYAINAPLSIFGVAFAHLFWYISKRTVDKTKPVLFTERRPPPLATNYLSSIHHRAVGTVLVSRGTPLTPRPLAGSTQRKAFFAETPYTDELLPGTQKLETHVSSSFTGATNELYQHSAAKQMTSAKTSVVSSTKPKTDNGSMPGTLMGSVMPDYFSFGSATPEQTRAPLLPTSQTASARHSFGQTPDNDSRHLSIFSEEDFYTRGSGHILGSATATDSLKTEDSEGGFGSTARTGRVLFSYGAPPRSMSSTLDYSWTYVAKWLAFDWVQKCTLLAALNLSSDRRVVSRNHDHIHHSLDEGTQIVIISLIQMLSFVAMPFYVYVRRERRRFAASPTKRLKMAAIGGFVVCCALIAWMNLRSTRWSKSRDGRWHVVFCATVAVLSRASVWVVWSQMLRDSAVVNNDWIFTAVGDICALIGVYGVAQCIVFWPILAVGNILGPFRVGSQQHWNEFFSVQGAAVLWKYGLTCFIVFLHFASLFCAMFFLSKRTHNGGIPFAAMLQFVPFLLFICLFFGFVVVDNRHLSMKVGTWLTHSLFSSVALKHSSVMFPSIVPVCFHLTKAFESGIGNEHYRVPISLAIATVGFPLSAWCYQLRITLPQIERISRFKAKVYSGLKCCFCCKKRRRRRQGSAYKYRTRK